MNSKQITGKYQKRVFARYLLLFTDYVEETDAALTLWADAEHFLLRRVPEAEEGIFTDPLIFQIRQAPSAYGRGQNRKINLHQ